MKFSGLDELVGQINHDVESADRILGREIVYFLCSLLNIVFNVVRIMHGV